MCSYIGKRKFKSIKKQMKISMKVCEKFQVKCVPISVQESSRATKSKGKIFMKACEKFQVKCVPISVQEGSKVSRNK